MTATHPAYRCALLLTAMLLVIGCQPRSKPTVAGSSAGRTPHAHAALQGEDKLDAMRGPRVDALRAEPGLRIRVGRSLTAAKLGNANAGSVSIGPGSADLGRARTYTFESPISISHDKLGFVITEPSGQSVRWRLGTLSVTGQTGIATLNDDAYPGSLELVATHNTQRQNNGAFDVVNHVGMEDYLPGVLSKELYPGWHLNAYRAQAIAARSYAIWEMNLPVRRSSHFDLEASQASQAYIGANANEKARTAVAETAGQVLVYERRVLPAFYSSCSGGTGQDAHAAWPGRVDDLAPLRGRDHGGWGQQSTKFRWGPVQRDRDALSKRIAAWGKVNNHRVALLGTINAIEVVATNRMGRPTEVRLSDDRGQTFTMASEELRMAGNFRASSLPTIDNETMTYSSHAEYHIDGDTVTVTGRGFGHGVGLCQFGAQHMANEGHNHRAILGFYYPGSRVKKVY